MAAPQFKLDDDVPSNQDQPTFLDAWPGAWLQPIQYVDNPSVPSMVDSPLVDVDDFTVAKCVPAGQLLLATVHVALLAYDLTHELCPSLPSSRYHVQPDGQWPPGKQRHRRRYVGSEPAHDAGDGTFIQPIHLAVEGT